MNSEITVYDSSTLLFFFHTYFHFVPVCFTNVCIWCEKFCFGRLWEITIFFTLLVESLTLWKWWWLYNNTIMIVFRKFYWYQLSQSLGALFSLHQTETYPFKVSHNLFYTSLVLTNSMAHFSTGIRLLKIPWLPPVGTPSKYKCFVWKE